MASIISMTVRLDNKHGKVDKQQVRDNLRKLKFQAAVIRNIKLMHYEKKQIDYYNSLYGTRLKECQTLNFIQQFLKPFTGQ